MYPFLSSQNFPLNQWYVAGLAREVTGKLLPRRILDTPVVMYRTEAGDVTAMLDMCPHRRIPLSEGMLQNDVVECRYHGFRFGSDGTCVGIPAQKEVPPGYKVRTFPIEQRWEWLWIWMGDPALADPSKIPDNEAMRLDRENWMSKAGERTVVKARYGLIHENLLDLSHLSFLHKNSIGSAGVVATKMQLREIDGHLEASRYVLGDNLDGQRFAQAIGVKGLVDRTMIQQFYPPSLHVTGSVFTSAKDGGINPGHEFGATRFFHALTPETAHTTHYFWGFARNFMIDSEPFNEGMAKEIVNALGEDIDALEAIEANLDPAANPADDVHCRADALGLRGRLMIDRMLANEAGERDPGAPLQNVA